MAWYAVEIVSPLFTSVSGKWDKYMSATNYKSTLFNIAEE
jgi:hypothetical protein